MAVNDNFINAEDALQRLNKAFDDHKRAISEAVTEMNSLNTQYQKLPSSVQQMISDSQKLNTVINNTSTALDNEAKAAAAAAKEQIALNLVQQEEEKINKALLTSKAKLVASQKENAKYLQDIRRRQQELNRSQRDEAQLLDKSTTAYRQMELRVKQLTQEYNHLATLKARGNQLDAAQEQRLMRLTTLLNGYNGKLKEVDATIGKNQRNVGNYASGWNGLANSINQITREMPAFAHSVQTGFLAISNNIPILTDEIKRLNLANKNLAAQGMATVPVWKQVIKQIFTLQTAMSLLITLSVIYGKEIGKFISSMFTTVDVTKLAEQAVKDYTLALAQAQGQTQSEIVILETLVAIIQDETQSREKRSQAIQVLQDKYPDYLKNLNEENIRSKEVSAAIDQISDALFRKAQVQAASQLIGEQYAKYLEKVVKETAYVTGETSSMATEIAKARQQQIVLYQETQKALSEASKIDPNVLKDLSTLNDEYNAFINMSRQAQNEFLMDKIIKERTEDALNEYEAFEKILQNILKDAPNLFDIFGYPKDGGKGKAAAEKQVKDITSLYDLIHFRISTRIEDENKLAETEEKTYQSRLDHLRAWVNHSMVLLQIETDEKRRLAEKAIKDGTADENALTLVTEEALRKRSLLQQDYANRISKIQQSEWDEQFKKIGLFTREQEVNLLEWENAFIESNLNMGKSYKDVQKDLTKEKRKQLEQQIKDLLAALETEIEMVAETCEQELQMREAVAEQVAKLNEIYLGYSKDQADAVSDVVDVFRELGNQIGINGTTWGNFFRGIFDGFEDSADAAKSFGQLMIEISETIVRHQNMQIENQIRNLERQKDVQLQFAGESEEARIQIEERFDRKKTKLMQQQARKEKALAIMQAIIATAVAVIKALPNPASAIAVGIIGAAQTAIIAGTPIPEFEHGVRNFEGGNAIINEKRDEVVTTPDGQVFKPKGRNLFVNLPKGANVYSSEKEFYREMNGILGHNNIMPVIQDVSNYGITKEQMEGIMAKTLAKQNVQNINLDKNGFVSYIIGRHSKTNILNNRVTFKGKNV